MFDHTQQQSTDEQRKAQALSLKRLRPPTQVPGYEPQKFLGAGAYGEVWVAVDRNTGRQVAIKFYEHRGGLDWSLLSREVEKLAFLSADRYVVQLLDVGWNAEPPFYVMEYVEQGSLDDLMRREGGLPVSDAVELFEGIAVGLLHAHAKGVLHCDLKPANVLVDQDRKPRLADFGQSRLSHEQTPALGTLFYMAPEQADLNAVPDVRWDVYALGALLYQMLTGSPPYRTDDAVTTLQSATDLDERLTRYRELIEQSPAPNGHKAVPGVDRQLTDLIDACLAKNPANRLPNVQAVLDSLAVRKKHRAWRPLVVLGAIGPALILLVIFVCGWFWFDMLLRQSDESLRTRALESNMFLAESVARTVSDELDRVYRAVEELAASSGFQRALENAIDDPDFAELRQKLNEPSLAPAERAKVLETFLAHPKRAPLQERLGRILDDDRKPPVASWLVNSPDGLQLARAPFGSTIGKNYAFRTYFTGRPTEMPADWRPGKDDHVQQTHLSAVFRSQENNGWIVAVSTPVYKDEENVPESRRRFLGVVTATRAIHRFVELERGNQQFAVLVDLRTGDEGAVVLEHPLFEKYEKRLPDRFLEMRLPKDSLPDKSRSNRENYRDPLGKDPEGGAFDKRWLAEMARVPMRDGYTGWAVIVQENYEEAIGETLRGLRSRLWTTGLVAVALVISVSTALWAFVIRILDERQRPTNKASAAKIDAAGSQPAPGVDATEWPGL